jgi:serine O-acetyltransferase
LAGVAAALVDHYQQHLDGHHLNATFLPSRDRVIDIIELLRRLTFPGFFDEQRLTSDNIQQHTRSLLQRLDELMYEQVRQTLRYAKNRDHNTPLVGGETDQPTNGAESPLRPGDDCDECDTQARRITNAFLADLPDIRSLLLTDLGAAFDGDPAATSRDETIFCYPGIDAIFTHRYAHRLYREGLPLLARIMTEYAHNETGIDIHPGATIGQAFFIDHGTGIVIGETVNIGDRVKVYQGVTLGALSTKGGQHWRGAKRHPTIEDDVTIYGGAIILGGQTVIGKGATIGGSVFLTKSVPPGHTVTMELPDPTPKPGRDKRSRRVQAEAFDPGI